MPGNLPTITSRSVVAPGEIDKPAEGFEMLLFWLNDKIMIVSLSFIAKNEWAYIDNIILEIDW